MNIKNKKLYRSPRQAIILGIAAGIGQYFEVDPVFVRLAWLVVGVLSNIPVAIIVYVALFFIIPIDPSEDTVPQSQKPKDVTPEKTEHMDSNQNV